VKKTATATSATPALQRYLNKEKSLIIFEKTIFSLKDGRTYVHCNICSRCVKPTWVHCEKCGRCALSEHPCELFRSKEEAEPKSKVKILLL